MPTGQSQPMDLSAATRMLDAIEQNDLDTMRACFVPGAIVWHNNDEIEQDIETVISTALKQLVAVSGSRAYEDRRVTIVGSQVFMQHTLIVTLRSGRQVRMPAMMRVEVNPDGQVARIEEYFDSRASDAIAEAAR
jgi:uncharacterized protein